MPVQTWSHSLDGRPDRLGCRCMFDLVRLLKVVDPDPVLVRQPDCLRVRHAGLACRACADICPAGAFQLSRRKVGVDAGTCSRCGLCLGVCPTAALQVRGIDESGLAAATRVRCAKAGGPGVVVPCLGALSPDLLIDVGSRRPGIVLAAGECHSCELARGGESARANLASAAEVLRGLGVTELPQWETVGLSEQASEQHAVSRRELLGLWRQAAVQTGMSLMPESEVNPVRLPARVPLRRVRWLKRLSPPEHNGRLAWPTRKVEGPCHGCNICVSFCPTGALAFREDDQTWTLSFQAAACVNCRTCIQLCPRGAVHEGEPPTARDVLAGTRRDLFHLTAADRVKLRPGSSLGDLG